MLFSSFLIAIVITILAQYISSSPRGILSCQIAVAAVPLRNTAHTPSMPRRWKTLFSASHNWLLLIEIPLYQTIPGMKMACSQTLIGCQSESPMKRGSGGHINKYFGAINKAAVLIFCRDAVQSLNGNKGHVSKPRTSHYFGTKCTAWESPLNAIPQPTPDAQCFQRWKLSSRESYIPPFLGRI